MPPPLPPRSSLSPGRARIGSSMSRRVIGAVEPRAGGRKASATAASAITSAFALCIVLLPQ